MRLIVLLLVIISILTSFSYIYGQLPNDLGYRFVPSKLVENTESTLQVYTEGVIPHTIDNLVITSLDPSIVKIVDIEQNEDNLVTDVKMKAISKGNTKIALAAPGFLSQEVPIMVYPNANIATQLLMKITPNIFPVNGLKEGFVSVELANEDGIPTYANEDTVVILSTPNTDIIKLKNSFLVIKKGEYFSIGKFEVKQSGEANLFASSTSVGMANAIISANSKTSQLKIQSYVYPETINDYSSAFAYLVVQLQDLSGNPVISKKDIPISVRVKNSSQTEQPNSSFQPTTIQVNEPLVIKQGSYWSYVPIAVTARLTGVYDISVSAKGYLVPDSLQLQTIPLQIMDDKSARIDLVPILATGKDELVGILHLENINGDPIIPKDNIAVGVDSSDPNTLSITNVQINRGDSAALVFGKTGKTDSPVTLTVITEDPQTLNPIIVLPEEDQLNLVAEPLVENVLFNTTFPMALYLSHPDGTPEYASIDVVPIVSPKESIVGNPTMLQKGQAVTLLNLKLMKNGPVTLSFMDGQFSMKTTIDVLSSAPSTVSLNYPQEVVSKSNNVFSIELLDDRQFPVFANKDIEIKLVSSDPSVVNVPENIIIKKGSYYSLFNVRPNAPGKTELSILANGMPLSEFSLVVTTLNPQVSLSTNDQVNLNSVFNATLSAQYNNLPISGLRVDWNVRGASIQSIDSITDKNGEATISLLSSELGKVDLQAIISGGLFADSTVSKEITVNATQNVQQQQMQMQHESVNLLGLNPIYIVIPIGALAAIFVLKKKNLLDGLTERIDFVAKFSAIKERLLQLRNRD